MEKHAILQRSVEGILAQMEPLSDQTGALACHATLFPLLSQSPCSQPWAFGTLDRGLKS